MLICCPHCLRKNRLDVARLTANPTCGACKHPLFNGQPSSVDGAGFARHVGAHLPLVVDFWAAWCGPCRQFAPTFAQGCAQTEPRARFLKVDTEAAPDLAARFAIRSIPTLLIVHQGKEIARVNGALPAGEFARWLQGQLPLIG
tara:strand:- start:552 stop:983 length:432 start_codon:yes stop_codon:yes gene_type:complete